MSYDIKKTMRYRQNSGEEQNKGSIAKSGRIGLCGIKKKQREVRQSTQSHVKMKKETSRKHMKKYIFTKFQ
jgi:hypothetical protein